MASGNPLNWKGSINNTSSVNGDANHDTYNTSNDGNAGGTEKIKIKWEDEDDEGDEGEVDEEEEQSEGEVEEQSEGDDGVMEEVVEIGDSDQAKGEDDVSPQAKRKGIKRSKLRLPFLLRHLEPLPLSEALTLTGLPNHTRIQYHRRKYFETDPP